MSTPDDEDDYESAFSLGGLPGVDEEITEEKGTPESEKSQQHLRISQSTIGPAKKTPNTLWIGITI